MNALEQAVQALRQSEAALIAEIAEREAMLAEVRRVLGDRAPAAPAMRVLPGKPGGTALLSSVATTATTLPTVGDQPGNDDASAVLTTRRPRTPLDVGKARALRAAGWSVNKIAEELGSTWATVNKHVADVVPRAGAEEAA